MKNRNLWRSRLRIEELEGRIVPALSYSTNWAGYAVTTNAGAVTAVSGNWVVPAVSTSVSGYSSAWVGIDGANSNSVEQIGTDSDYVNGQAHYYAWYEMYPAGSVNLGLTVKPGDTISASVAYGGAGQFTLSITDVSRAEPFATTQSSSAAQRSSAEWIQEAPSSFKGVLPLSNFGTINFSKSTAVINNTPGPINNPTPNTAVEQIDMVTSAGALKASTSGLTDSGTPSTSGFSVTWVSSGAGGGGHGKKAPITPTDPTQASSAGLGISATTVVGALSGSGSRFALPTTSPAAVASPSAVTAPTVSPFQQASLTLTDRSVSGADADPTAMMEPDDAPDLLPAPTETGAPGNGAAATAPMIVPVPGADQSPASQPMALRDLGLTGDTVFVDQRWEPAANIEAASTVESSINDDLTSGAPASPMVVLALGGAWAIATREAAARRRRETLIGS